MSDEQKMVNIYLVSFLKELSAVYKKYLPDKLGSDGFKAEMFALITKYTGLIDTVYNPE